MDVYTLDAGIMGESPIPVSVTREEVAQLGGETLLKVQNMGHEGHSLASMIRELPKNNLRIPFALLPVFYVVITGT